MTESALIPSACAPEGLVLLRAAGEDAEKFLHGQFTNRVEGIGGAVRLAGWCDGRGRLHAVLRVWAEADGLRLLLPAEIADRFLKRIRMYVLRARVTLEALPAAFELYLGREGEARLLEAGLSAPAPGERLTGGFGTLLGLEPTAAAPGLPEGGQRILRILPEAASSALPASSEAWLAGEAAAGVPVVLAPTIGAFVPQHVNLDLAGGVVFNKGCYPGQEVVSRMHHLGETPRRGLILASEEALQLEPGAPIFSGEDEAGAALSLARTGRGTLLFASVKRSLAAGTLRAGSPKGAELSAVKLPYGGI